jgi:hypothetical protein
MIAISQSKSSALNRLEGFALTALLGGLPTAAITLLTAKLMGNNDIFAVPGGAATVAVLISLFYALIGPPLGCKFPKTFKYGYEPSFYDADLSVAEKIAQWRVKPLASVQLLSIALVLSLLVVCSLSQP